ncbi:MAG: DUF4179 domain-containing protein [Lachnospiraceae bacterium]
MKDKMDELLKEALTPRDEPSELLNHRVLQKGKESMNMNKKSKRKVSAAAIGLACLLACGCGTAYAAYRYLTPSNVAHELKHDTLEKAFEGKDAKIINESQEFNGYRITLLGIVSGKKLVSDEQCHLVVDGEEVKNDYSYTVIAVERTDGTPFQDYDSKEITGVEKPDLSIGFCVKGMDPCEINTDIGGSSFVKDGVYYNLMITNNMEYFADKDIYLRVNSTGDWWNDDVALAYDYNEKTGEITRNTDYYGINALFKIPLDKKKANAKAAQEYLDLYGHWDIDGMERAENRVLRESMKKITLDNLEQYAEPIKESEEILKINSLDVIHYSTLVEGSSCVRDTYRLTIPELFPDRKQGSKKLIFQYTSCISYTEGEEDSLKKYIRIEEFTLNKDDTVKHVTYRLKNK